MEYIESLLPLDRNFTQQQKKNVRGRRIGNTIGYLDLGGGSLPVGISIVEND